MRDPRLTVHNVVRTNRGDEREFSIRGRALEVVEAAPRDAFLKGREDVWGDRQFHLFAIDVESVSFVHYADGEQRVEVWPSGTTLRRPY